jgi:hypothetical protein
VEAAYGSPAKARERNKDAILACSFDTPSGKDESGHGNDGSVAGVEVGKGKEGNAIWFRKSGKKPAGNAANNGSFVQHDWNQPVPLFARAMALAKDTLFVAGPPDEMDEEYTFERIMAGDKSVDRILEQQDAALNGKEGGTLLAVSASGGNESREIKLDSLPVWDGIAIANGAMFVASEDGKVSKFGGK